MELIPTFGITILYGEADITQAVANFTALVLVNLFVKHLPTDRKDSIVSALAKAIKGALKSQGATSSAKRPPTRPSAKPRKSTKVGGILSYH